jgi:hypothetical protein
MAHTAFLLTPHSNPLVLIHGFLFGKARNCGEGARALPGKSTGQLELILKNVNSPVAAFPAPITLPKACERKH